MTTLPVIEECLGVDVHGLQGESALGDLAVVARPAHPLQDRPLGRRDGLHLAIVQRVADSDNFLTSAASNPSAAIGFQSQWADWSA